MHNTFMVKPKPGTRRTQVERSESTRAALLEAGRRLFSELGYAHSGQEAIVSAAGVTRGALQHHFGTKQALFIAVYEDVEREVVAAVAEAAMAVGSDGPLEMLRSGCQAYLDAVLDPTVRRISAVDGPAVMPTDTRQEITDRYAMGLVREVVEQAVQVGEIRDTPPEPLARMLLAGVIAAAEYVATAPDPLVARAEAGKTVDLLLANLKE
jgi:AcrR family transcriptional regulator